MSYRDFKSFQGRAIAIMDAMEVAFLDTLGTNRLEDGPQNRLFEEIVGSPELLTIAAAFARGRVKKFIESLDILTLGDVTRILGITENQVKRLVSEGELRAHRGPDRTMVFRRDEIERLKDEPPPKIYFETPEDEHVNPFDRF